MPGFHLCDTQIKAKWASGALVLSEHSEIAAVDWAVRRIILQDFLFAHEFSRHYLLLASVRLLLHCSGMDVLPVVEVDWLTFRDSGNRWKRNPKWRLLGR